MSELRPIPALSAPLWVGLSVTRQCNLRCVHCIYSAGRKDEVEFTTGEILDLLDQCRAMGVLTVEFLGGEPLCREDLDTLIDAAVERDLKVVLNTNATLIDRAWVERNRRKVMLVKVGFDGHESEEHNRFRGSDSAFERTCRAIGHLQDAGLDTCLITTLHKGNFRDIRSVVRTAARLVRKGVFTVTLFTPLGRGEGMAEQRLEANEVREALAQLRDARLALADTHPGFLIKEEIPESFLFDPESERRRSGRRLCTAAITQMGISSDGYAYPCTAMVGYRRPDHDVRRCRLEAIWRESHLFRTVRDRSAVEGKCGRCPYLAICGGGCRYAAWARHGDLLAEDPSCWFDPGGHPGGHPGGRPEGETATSGAASCDGCDPA